MPTRTIERPALLDLPAVAERRIPFLKWGQLLRFDPTELEAWLDRARRS